MTIDFSTFDQTQHEIREFLEALDIGARKFGVSREYYLTKVLPIEINKILKSLPQSAPLDPSRVSAGARAAAASEAPQAAAFSGPKMAAIRELKDEFDFSTEKEEVALTRISELANSGRAFSKTELRQIYSYLFDTPGRFETFLRQDGSTPLDQNHRFESFLRILDTDLLNERATRWTPIVLRFAFSDIRFNWIQLQDAEIPADLSAELLAYEATLRSGKPILTQITELKQKNAPACRKWIDLRTSGSTTIADGSTLQDESKKCWIRAQGKLEERLQTAFTGFPMIQILQRILGGAESNPGELREHSASSGTAELLYPTFDRLPTLTDEYAAWLSAQIEACERGEKSVILTAAQAYQRLVSIHPFENANGRIGRLMMDYVLMKFNLPPAALGGHENVLDSVFALRPKSPDAGVAFVQKIFAGVRASKEFLDQA